MQFMMCIAASTGHAGFFFFYKQYFDAGTHTRAREHTHTHTNARTVSNLTQQSLGTVRTRLTSSCPGSCLSLLVRVIVMSHRNSAQFVSIDEVACCRLERRHGMVALLTPSVHGREIWHPTSTLCLIDLNAGRILPYKSQLALQPCSRS